MLSGVLNINKPEGPSSFFIVDKIKKLTGTKKVGHTGTLDPFASGVLVVCLGEGTKIIPYMDDKEKEYEVIFEFGMRTDTYDKTGEVLDRSDFKGITDMDLRACMKKFIGEIDQVPPKFSAIKKNGKPLYKYARAGIDITPESRKVVIKDIILNDFSLPKVQITVKCEKGTYIRSLVNDIGNDLKVGAVTTGLERTRSGDFRIEDSIKISEPLENKLVSLSDCLPNFEKIVVNKEQEEKILKTGMLSFSHREGLPSRCENEFLRIVSQENNLVAIAETNPLKIKRVIMHT